MQPACKEYTGFLAELNSAPYAVQAAAFWAMEAIYNQVRGTLQCARTYLTNIITFHTSNCSASTLWHIV